MEKVELEQKIQDLEQALEDATEIAQLQVHRDKRNITFSRVGAIN